MTRAVTEISLYGPETPVGPGLCFVALLIQNGVSSKWMLSGSARAVESLVFCGGTGYNNITVSSRAGHVCSAGPELGSRCAQR